MQDLTSCTMAKLRVERLFTAQLKLYTSTVTASFIFNIEALSTIGFFAFFIMDLVWLAEFPIVFLAVYVRRGVAVGLRGFLFGFLWRGHFTSGGMGAKGLQVLTGS
jgi:hypothetical protein